MDQRELDLREFAARGGSDDRVHLVDADPGALLDPSPYRTRCGEPVLEVYNGDRPVTCSACRDAGSARAGSGWTRGPGE